MTFDLVRRLVRAAALAVLACGVAAPAGAADAQVEGTGETIVEVESAPVVLDGYPLFRVAGIASTVPAARRAERISARIAALGEDAAVDPAKITVRKDASARTLVYGGRPILSVTGADAALMTLDVDTTALAYVDVVRDTLGRYRSERSAESLRSAGWRAVVAAVVAAVGLALALWLLRLVDRAVDRRLTSRIATVGIQSFEIVRAERIHDAIEAALSFARWALVAIAVLAFADYALAQFPWTRAAAVGGLGLVLGPLKVLGAGLVSQLPNLAFLVVLVLVLRLLLRLVRLFFDAVAKGRVTLKDFDPEWAEPTYKLMRLVIVAFAVIVAYPYIPGSSSDAFKGVSIFVGVVFSLASTTAIANMIAGYALIYRRAFKVGDRVAVDGTVGVVTRSRLQVTHLRTRHHEEVIVPNSTLLNGRIVNYSTYAAQDGLAVSVSAGIGYETPWRQVEAILLEAAAKTEGVLREPPPYVLHQGLGDFCVTYELNAFVADALASERIRTALSRSVLDAFNAYGVQIMTPNYEDDPKEPKLVKREDWHLAPAAPASPATPANRER
ncbi:MAG: mechanosensitive ion channel [Burkholderiales bacterium]|nr:mechanosensitive ion channel [Burkholderiales bacterium]